MKWRCSDPVLQKLLIDFYPSALKITGEKSVMGIAAGCALFVVQRCVAPSLSIFQFLCVWERKITFEAGACYCLDTCGFEHWGNAPCWCSGALGSALPPLMWCHLFCLCLLDLIMINPVQSAQRTVPQNLLCCQAPSRHC